MSSGARIAVLIAASAVVGCALAVACVVAPIDLADRRCDDAHPCVDGYVCVDNTCELPGDGASG